MTDQQDLRARLLARAEDLHDLDLMDRKTAELLREAAAQLGRVESSKGLVAVEEASCVPHIHPELGSGLFFTEDAIIDSSPKLPAGVPDGWQFVPNKPTDNMRDAGNIHIKNRGALFAAWKAMLAAAPQPDRKESAPVAGSVDDAVLRFVAEIMKYWSDGDLDGGYRQELAVKHGILVPVEVTESCGEYCSCAEYDGFPQTCYRPSPILKAANAALQATRRSDGEKG